jgi:DNA-binding GntR family transcriptional regulator
MKAIGDARTLTSRVYGILRDAILDGTLAPEQPIKIEEVATELNVSAIPVREAVLRLVADGFIVAEPHKLYRIAPVSRKDLTDIYTLRLLLEPEAAKRSVPLLTEQDLGDLRDLYAHIVKSARSDQLGDVLSATMRFHFRLYQVLGSDRLMGILSTLWNQSERYRRIYLKKRKESEVIADHREILDQCIARQPDKCAAAVVEDLTKTVNAVMLRIEK